MKQVNLGKFGNRSRNPGDLDKKKAYLEAQQKKIEETIQIAARSRARAAQGIIDPDSEHESDPEEQDTADEDNDDESEDSDEPDSRNDYPVDVEEEHELHDAMLPTILHFLDLTGELPVVTNWTGNYVIIHRAIWLQLRHHLGNLEGEIPPPLVGYGSWTGGITYVSNLPRSLPKEPYFRNPGTYFKSVYSV